MELVKTIELKCGQTYLLKLNDGNVLEAGDVFMSREKGYGTRPYHFPKTLGNSPFRFKGFSPATISL